MAHAIATSVAWTFGSPIVLSFFGQNHWFAYVMASVGGYSLNAYWRAHQQNLVLRHMWISMSDEYVEHLEQLWIVENMGRHQVQRTRWENIVDQHGRLMRAWGIPSIDQEDRYRLFEK